ncbi:uncharacterized protein V6R79_020876 [Siganus canaliculatus]
MRGDTTVNWLEGDGPGDSAAAADAFGERRPSIVRLQSTLKKVSQSPFHSQYTTHGSSTSDSSGSSATNAPNKQESVCNGHAEKEVLLDAVLVPPPEFQSSPLDTEVKTLEEPFPALFSSYTPGNFQMSSSNGTFQDLTLNTPDLFKPVPAQRENSSDLLNTEGTGLFQASKAEDLFQAEHTREQNLSENPPSLSSNPFQSTSIKDDDLFNIPQPKAVNPFHTPMTEDFPTINGDLFHTGESKPSAKEDVFDSSFKTNLDLFSPNSANPVDPFPSPITRDLFQDFSGSDDPFSPTPSKQLDPFQTFSSGTQDIFQPLPSKSNGMDGVTSSVSSSPLDVAPAATPSSERDYPEIILTTPQGTDSDILQPTPFTRARNLARSPSQFLAAKTHLATMKRPPKPLPRTRPPRPEKPPKPEKPPRPDKPPTPVSRVEPETSLPKLSPKTAPKPLPKPALRRKPKTPDSKPVEPENYVFFQDILLTGQERCIEDWPEDSPHRNPDFKPAGTFKLRRESLKTKADSDGGSGDDPDASGKKKDKKFNMSLLSRRGSKEKSGDDVKEGKSRTLPSSRKSSKEYNLDSAEHDMDQMMDYKKKPLKTKINPLLRRASTASFMPDGKYMNGHLPQESKDNGTSKRSISKKESVRRWSEGTALDHSSGEEEEEEDGENGQHDDSRGLKKRKKMKIKFVPHRGFAITLEKRNEELKGAQGYTPRKGSKENSQEDLFGEDGYTVRKKSQDDEFEDVEDLKRLQSKNKASFTDDDDLQKPSYGSLGFTGDEEPYAMEDCKPKKSTKMKLLHVGRRSSKEDMLDDTSHQKKKGSFSAEELDDDELNRMDHCKPKKSKHKGLLSSPRKSKIHNGHTEQNGFDGYDEDEITQAAKKGFTSPEDMYDSEQDEVDVCKTQKKVPKLKRLKKFKKSKAADLQHEDPPGAASSEFLSEAAQAEWLAAQMDEQAMAGLEDEDEEEDTDSLMEWWYTVEQWDEVPSDDEDKVMQEDESKSFTALAHKVHLGLRVFNKVFTERAEALWQAIITLHAIADDISNFHHKAKIAGITGGTTTAVGGVTAIAGLALAPITLGASLVITAVGVGVATAGGIASASAAISDNVNNMHDRKKVEVVLEEYETHLLDLGKILHFVNQGLYKLRGHPFLRSGTQHYSEDWEVRRAVQMISLVDSPVMQAVDVTDSATAAVQGLFKGIDKYFIKDSRELKKGCKKEVVAQIKDVANTLNDGIVELNSIREELQDAVGGM